MRECRARGTTQWGVAVQRDVMGVLVVRNGALIVAALAVGSGSGCSNFGGCDDYASAGLNVFPVDAAGDPVCDAVVTATDGDYSEVLSQEYRDDCAYVGAWERKGDYVVQVEAAQGTKTTDVRVGADRCHVKPVVVTVPLPT